MFVCLYGEGRPRLDLEYPSYGTHELADEGAFTSVVVLTATFPSKEASRVECNEINH